MNAIREFRKKKGWTQKDLADKLGVALDTISRYETESREPRASELKKMAEIFGCSVDAILNPTPSPAAENRQGTAETM